MSIVLDEQRAAQAATIAKQIKAYYGTDQIKASLARFLPVNGERTSYSETAFTRATAANDARNIEKAIRDRKAQIEVDVQDSFNVPGDDGKVKKSTVDQRKTAIAQAAADDEVLRLLNEEYSDKQLLLAGLDAEMETRRIELRAIESLAALTTAELVALGGY